MSTVTLESAEHTRCEHEHPEFVDLVDVDAVGATEKLSVAPALPTLNNPAFSLASASAFKLLQTLRYLAAAGESGGSCEQLGAITGLSDRTVGTALLELELLGWARVARARGVGIRFSLLEPPGTLSPRAVEHYAEKIAKARERLDRREQELKKAERGDHGP